MKSLPATARCLNPNCAEPCFFDPHLPGRQPLYCSDGCRAVTSRERRTLQQRMAVVESDLETSRSKEAEQLRVTLSHLRWVLKRYPTTG